MDEALALRAWALSLLQGGSPGDAPPASDDGWRAFLVTERCALALSARLGAAALRAPALAPLAAQARVEAKRVLSARAQLARIGAAAAERGWRVGVLKGGVPLLRGGNGPDLMDLDVWASAADAAALARLLDAEGYLEVERDAAHRLGVRARPDAIQVEIHTAVPGLAGGDPWRHAGRVGRLWALSPADHLWHLLLHSTEQHPDRRGRIRELLVLGDALAAASAEDLAAVERRIEGRAYPPLLHAQLSLASRLLHRRGAGVDPFALTAATGYLLAELHRRSPAYAPPGVWRAAAAAAARREGAPSEIGGGTLDLPSARRPVAWLRRVAPRAERAARILVRRAPEWALAPAGEAVAAAAARAVRRRAGHPSAS